MIAPLSRLATKCPDWPVSPTPASARNRRFDVPPPTFLFPLETPLWLSRNMLRGWKDNSVLAKTLAACTYLYSIVSELYDAEVNAQVQKSLFLPHFCLPWGHPWGNHAKCCTDGKRIRCLQIVSQHVPIYVQQFPSYSNRNCKKSPFSRTAVHIFVSPGDAPAIITQYVVWMERQFNACQTPCSMYLSIFNSFRVIQCLSRCVSPKIAIFTTFLFPLGMPLGQSR